MRFKVFLWTIFKPDKKRRFDCYLKGGMDYAKAYETTLKNYKAL